MNATSDTTRPTEQHAHDIVSHYLQSDAFSLRRFPTGLCHYVYEVLPRDGVPVVLRMGHEATRAHLAGSIYWSERLIPLGVPVPEILFIDLDGPFPYTIIEHFQGRDLGEVYPALSEDAKRNVAHEVSRVQGLVQKLPKASGYGFAYDYADTRLQRSWHDVINQLLVRARQWITENNVCNVSHVDTVESGVPSLRNYFDQVEPTAFLHDTTTKNVLVCDSKLRGIVDVDDICFGDPLLVLALTNMAILSRGWNPDYVEFWAERWSLTKIQREALKFYTALFCITFMGEIGQKFNKDSVLVDRDEVARFERILDSLVAYAN